MSDRSHHIISLTCAIALFASLVVLAVATTISFRDKTFAEVKWSGAAVAVSPWVIPILSVLFYFGLRRCLRKFF